MSVSYEQHELTRTFLNLMAVQTHITAAQMQAVLFPFQTWLNSVFNPMRLFSGTQVKMTGVDTLARMNPFLNGFSQKFPGSVEISYEAAAENDGARQKGDRDHLKLQLSLTEPHKNLEALAEIFNMAAREYPKPDFRIETATILGKTRDVTQQVLVDKPFASLRLFETGYNGPLLYLAAPISGHYSTLIRDTVQSALNAGFRVALYDTKNARDVPLRAGDFGLDDCVDYHQEFIEFLGKNVDPRVNVQAICQATVPVSRAAARMAREGSPYTPFTLDLDAGPMNPHAAMTEVTEFAQKYNIDWFRKNLISRVPAWFEGAGREVYPGFRQLAAFMTMNLGLHASSFYEMFNHLVKGTDHGSDYQKKQEFYDEYLSLCDLPAKFYLDTIETVFIRGNRVDLSAYRGYLLTKEAALDDISAPGQTMYAHEMMPHAKGYHYTLEGAGHYGIFAGAKARDKALPVMFSFIHNALRENGHDYGPVLDSHGKKIKNSQMPETYSRQRLESTLEKQRIIWGDFQEKRAKISHNVPQITVTLPPFALKAA